MYPEVAGAWLARGDARARSDVDLALDPVDPPGRLGTTAEALLEAYHDRLLSRDR